jgi:hypothetical protein
MVNCGHEKTSNCEFQLTMQAPTTYEIRDAIQVLKKLCERLNEHATHSKLQMPESQLGKRYASQIEVKSIEQIARIEVVSAQLQNWRDELLQQQKQSISNHV